MIKSAIKTPNNMVMVFDENGEQIPEYQGDYEEVRENILRDAPLTAVFAYWLNHADEPRSISKEDW